MPAQGHAQAQAPPAIARAFVPDQFGRCRALL